MKYDFDKIINRRNTASYKWDQAENLFGSTDVLPMWVADMDFEAPPEVLEAIKNRAAHGVFGYSFRTDGYYEAIMNWQKTRHGWDIKKEWITSSPGVVTALSLAIETLTEPGDKIILQSPVYYPFYDVIKMNKRELVDNPLKLENNYYTIDFDRLEKQAADGAKMLLLCNPHNPGGRVWKKEELVRLGEICLKHNVIVVADEIHEDVVYSGHRHIPFGSISEDFAQNSVICTAPSKTFNLAGLQSSAILIPNAAFRKKYNNRLKSLSIHMESNFGGIALETSYAQGGPWLDALLEYLEGNLDYLLCYFELHMPEIPVMKPEGTYMAWLDFRSIAKDAKSLKDWMYTKAKVAMNEGSVFGKAGEGFLRLNFACPRSILEDGLKRLSEAVHASRS